MGSKSIIVVKKEGVAWVIFNRPDVMNALDIEAVDSFYESLDELDNDESIKVVILTGAGKAFSAGGDFNLFLELQAKGNDATQSFFSKVSRVVLKIAKLKKFVIASVNGDAMGGGFGFALASDIIIASEKARFGLTFIKIGLVPDSGITYFLPRIVGYHKAKELFVNGEIINAEKALQLNIVNNVVPDDQLETITADMAKKLSTNPATAMGFIKRLVDTSMSTGDLAAIIELEMEAQTVCFQSEEANSLIQDFFRSRKSRSERKGK